MVTVGRSPITTVLRVGVTLGRNRCVYFGNSECLSGHATSRCPFVKERTFFPVKPFHVTTGYRIPIIFCCTVERSGHACHFVFRRTTIDKQGDVKRLARRCVASLRGIIGECPQR